jgi:hypothetical protein
MDRSNDRQGRASQHEITGPGGAEKPTHPHLHATLLMLGVVFFLVVVAALEVR